MTKKVIVPIEDFNALKESQAEEKLLIAVRRHEYSNGLPLGITVRRVFFSLLPEKIKKAGVFEVERREDKSKVEIPLLWADQVLHFDQETVSLDEALKRKCEPDNPVGLFGKLLAWIKN